MTKKATAPTAPKVVKPVKAPKAAKVEKAPKVTPTEPAPAPRSAAALKAAKAADAKVAAEEAKSGLDKTGVGIGTIAVTGEIIPKKSAKRLASEAAIANAEPRSLKVRATQTGYYDERRYREGDVFLVAPSAFSEKWMEEVDPQTPESITTGQQELTRKHDETLVARAGANTGATDVI